MSPNIDQKSSQKSRTNSQTLSTASVEKLCTKNINYPSYSKNLATNNPSPSHSSTPTPSPISTLDSSPSFVGPHDTVPHSSIKLASNYNPHSPNRNGEAIVNQSIIRSTRDSTTSIDQSGSIFQIDNNQSQNNMNVQTNFPVPLGLQNLGNTCYMNSAMQVIYHTASLRNSILSWNPSSLNQNDMTEDLQFAWDVTASLQRLFANLEQLNPSSSSSFQNLKQPDEQNQTATLDSNSKILLSSKTRLQNKNTVETSPLKSNYNGSSKTSTQQKSTASARQVPNSPSSNLSDDTDSVDHYIAESARNPSLPKADLQRSPSEEDFDKTYGNSIDNKVYDYISPHEIVNLLRDQDRCIYFDARGQQDAHEFLRFLLEKVDTCLKASKSTNPSNDYQSPNLINQTIEGANNERKRSPPHPNICDTKKFETIRKESENNINETSSKDEATKSKLDDETKSGQKRARDGDTEDSQESRKVEKYNDKSTPNSVNHSNKNKSTRAQGPSSKNYNQANRLSEKKKKRARHEIIPSLFEGKSIMTTRCCTCETESRRTEAFMDVALPVKAGKSLEWALSSQGIAEELRGSNKYYCEFCNTYCEAQRWWRLAELPDVLTIQLKLFEFDVPHRAGGGKVSVAMSCPLQMKFKKWCSQQCDEKDDEYKLTGIIVHEGSGASSGHYYSYIYKSEYDQWFCFDDSTVSQVAEAELKDLFSAMSSYRTAYILFYTRCAS